MLPTLEIERQRELIAVVDRLEETLRRMQLWEAEPPSEAELGSAQPFCFDTLDFPQWLQWQLIPRMRRIFAGDGHLPMDSAIHPYAEDCVADLTADPTELLFLISRFDALIRGAPAAATH